MTWGKQNSEEEAMKQLDVAFDEYGVNFIDTAEGYPIPLQPETQGDTDRLIAKWMKGRQREKIILATKVLNPSLPSLPCPLSPPPTHPSLNVSILPVPHSPLLFHLFPRKLQPRTYISYLGLESHRHLKQCNA